MKQRMAVLERLEDLRHDLSLRLVLSFAFAVSALFGAVVVGGALKFFAPATVQSMLVGGLQDSAKDAAQALERSLVERKREIELTTNAAEFRAPIRDAAALRLLLRRVQEISPYYELVGFIGPDGRFEATSNGQVEGEDASGRDYWRVGRQRAYVSDAHKAIAQPGTADAADNAPSLVDVAAPVYDGEAFKGVVVGRLSMEWAADVGGAIAQRVLSHFPSASVELVDGQGNVIFSARGEAIARAQLGMSAKAAETEPDFGRDPLLASAEVSGLGPGSALHWTVRIAAPRTDQLAITAGVRHWLWASGLASVFLAAAAGWIFGGWISRPLEGAAAGILAMAAGRSPPEIRSGLRELDDIGSALALAACEPRRNQADGES